MEEFCHHFSMGCYLQWQGCRQACQASILGHQSSMTLHKREYQSWVCYLKHLFRILGFLQTFLSQIGQEMKSQVCYSSQSCIHRRLPLQDFQIESFHRSSALAFRYTSGKWSQSSSCKQLQPVGQGPRF
jgi:hypothetical protein